MIGLSDEEREALEIALDGGRMYDDVPEAVERILADRAGLSPEATEIEEWGWRYENGFVTVLSRWAMRNPDPIKPNVRRTRTTYADRVTEWEEVDE